MKIPFVKMEGLGNDYIHVDGIRTPFPLERGPELARLWSDRHFGIGADGLIVLLHGDRAPVRMVMWNADGSRGAMCGNGLRCVAALAHAHGHAAARRFDVETDAGVRAVAVVAMRSHGTATVRADLGAITVADAPELLQLGADRVEVWPGDAGNPHAVVFVADVDAAPVGEIGAALQRHHRFPGGVNVEFVEVTSGGALRQRTFERGSGETLACGTGAATAALTALRRGLVPGPRVPVALRGGVLHCDRIGATLVIEGPARTVFAGEIELPERSA